MRLKRAVALIGSALLVLVIFMIYSAKDLSEFTKKKAPHIDFESVSGHLLSFLGWNPL